MPTSLSALVATPGQPTAKLGVEAAALQTQHAPTQGAQAGRTRQASAGTCVNVDANVDVNVNVQLGFYFLPSHSSPPVSPGKQLIRCHEQNPSAVRRMDQTS